MDVITTAMAMDRRVLLLRVLAISFLLLFFFYSFGTSLKAQVFIDSHEPSIMKANLTDSKLVDNHEEPYIFSKYDYLNLTQKPFGNVIAFLVPSPTGKLDQAFNPYLRLRERILQLDERLDDNNSTDVIIFHTGYPFRADILPIIEGSRRQIEFVNVDHVFYKFSPGFDPYIREPTWVTRGKWNYQHMCYFWFKQVFELKIMQRYRYMMRLDDDSQLLGKWPNVFDLMVKHQALYFANKKEIDYDHLLPGTTLVRNLITTYIKKNNIIVQNPDMLADIFSKASEIPNYWNNIEIVDLSFIRRKEVVDFIQAIDESGGIFLYRWGDAPLRYIILALFTTETQVLHREKLGLNYCHLC